MCKNLPWSLRKAGLFPPFCKVTGSRGEGAAKGFCSAGKDQTTPAKNENALRSNMRAQKRRTAASWEIVSTSVVIFRNRETMLFLGVPDEGMRF